MMAVFVAAGSDAGIPSEVRMLVDPELDGTYEHASPGTLGEPFSFSPFGAFEGGVRVAMGDFDGDGNDELAVAAGPGGGPHVKIYDLTSSGLPGALVDSFFAYPEDLTAGVFIAAGDLDSDGRDELITAPDQGAQPLVKIFSDADHDGLVSDDLRDEFMAYHPDFRGGVRLATSNLTPSDGEGGAELITAAGPGGGPHVIVWQDIDRDGAVSDDPRKNSFYAYDPQFTGGVYVAGMEIANVIITGAGAGGGPHVRIFQDFYGDGQVSTVDEFFAYDAAFTGGVRLATNFFQIITAPGPGGGPHVKVFADDNDEGFRYADNPTADEHLVLDANNTGVFVAGGGVYHSSHNPIDTPARIPTLGILNSSVFVPPSEGIVSSVEVSLSLSYSFSVGVSLQHLPSGRTVSLFFDPANHRSLIVRLSDLAIQDLGVAAQNQQIVIGEYNPMGDARLSDFSGLDASGEWRLRVSVGEGSASFVDWSLHFRH